MPRQGRAGARPPFPGGCKKFRHYSPPPWEGWPAGPRTATAPCDRAVRTAVARDLAVYGGVRPGGAAPGSVDPRQLTLIADIGYKHPHRRAEAVRQGPASQVSCRGSLQVPTRPSHRWSSPALHRSGGYVAAATYVCTERAKAVLNGSLTEKVTKSYRSRC
jgi:hypothetical protein